MENLNEVLYNAANENSVVTNSDKNLNLLKHPLITKTFGTTLGITLFTFGFIFIILAIIRPSFTVTKHKKIIWNRILIISIISSIIVLLTPQILCLKSLCK